MRTAPTSRLATFAAALLALSALAAPIPARAIYFEPSTGACGAAAAGAVGGALACERSATAAEDQLDPAVTVNEEAFFGHNQWVPLGRWEASELPDPRGGAFDLGAVFETVAHVLLVFAGGPGTAIVGYLLDAPTGVWTSPFPAGEVARMTYYGLGTPNAALPTETGVPLPASLALFGAGLFGLAAVGLGGGGRHRPETAAAAAA